MGASRKLQGEIDRVLKGVNEGVEVFDGIWNKVYDPDLANQKEKFEVDLKKEIKKLQRYRDQIKTWIQSSEIKDKKVSASYEQSLTDARKSIEREMERFKVCEKETKTKAFSKEGLGQQPKTDPKEKAKVETRDWINTVVADLENQIDSFEAEAEGLSIPIKKGKARSPRLIHLEKSIARHKSHIKKLESILRLLDNNELSPDDVNYIKELIEDYVDRNQDDFDEFSDVDEFYNSLPEDMVEALEEIVLNCPSVVAKTTLSTSSQGNSQDQTEETASQESNSDSVPRTPPAKIAPQGLLVTAASPSTTVSVPVPSTSGLPAAVSTVQTLVIAPTESAPKPSPADTLAFPEITPEASLSYHATASNTPKEEDGMSLPVCEPSPVIEDHEIGNGISPNQLGTSNSVTNNPVPVTTGVSTVSMIPDFSKINLLSTEEKAGTSVMPPQLLSPLGSNTLSQQLARNIEVIASGFPNSANVGPASVGQDLSTLGVPGVQRRPPTASSFDSQNDTIPFCGRPEISPDQREKFLQKYQQVQQPSLSINTFPQIQGPKQNPIPTAQQKNMLQQSSSISPLGIDHGVPSSAGIRHAKLEEQMQQRVADDVIEYDAIPISLNATSYTSEGALLKESDLLPGQSWQSGIPLSYNVDGIGQRSIPDFGGSGISNPDHNYNKQLLEAAFHRLPLPRDLERLKISPRKPAIVPTSYPDIQSPTILDPHFWETAPLDTLFFAFYYQQKTYLQYLAARELKRRSWRFHKRLKTWFQQHNDPVTRTNEYEKGSYVYFDYNGNPPDGWCQRVLGDFTFEYEFLEDELQVPPL